MRLFLPILGTVTLKAPLRFSVQNGRIAIAVGRVDIGGVNVPSSLIATQVSNVRQNAERQLNAELASIAESNGLVLQTLTTTDDGLTLLFVQ